MSTISYQTFINYISTYVDLEPNEESLLMSKLSHRRYLKDQYLVQQGEICTSVNFILKGSTKTFYLDKEGHEHIIMFSIERWWAADLGSFISRTPADYYVQFLEDTELIQISDHLLEELYCEVPKMERFFRKIVERAFVAAQKRIVRNFSLTAKERYQLFKKDYPEIEQRIPQYMIASYLGITKEFLSKVKSQIARSG